MKEFLKDKKKYILEPQRLRVHVGYLLIICLSIYSKPQKSTFLAGSVLIFLGILIRAWASGIVKKDEELATEGPYSLSRNPLYVGNILIGYGFAFLNSMWWSYVLVTVYLLFFYPLTILKEERKMNDFFGEEFQKYKRNVSLLIPFSLKPYETLLGWNFKQYFYENKDFFNEGAVLLFWIYTLFVYL